MHILIVEDDTRAAHYLQKGLTEQGYITDVANDGHDAINQINHNQFDAIILDVMLPGLSGWDVIKQLREINKQTPVLFLTARDEVDDRVKGFELGADDYLVKPFAFAELVARLQALLRRGQVQQTEKLILADLEVNLLQRKAKRAGKSLPLSPKEFSLLALLLRNKSRPLTRTYIAEQVWDINFASDTNVIDVAMRRLRQKIDNDFTQKLIHTVRGVGYVME